MPNLSAKLVAQLIAMLHDCSFHVQSYLPPKDRATSVDTPELFCIVIHSDERPAAQHVRQYNGLHVLEVAVLVTVAEDGIVCLKEIEIRREEELNDS